MEMVKPIHVAKLRRARAPWVFELHPVTLVLATLVLVSVTSLLYLTQASRVAATGYDISSAEERRAELERQQQLLIIQKARLEAMSRIERDATTRLGMVPAPLPEYLRTRRPPVDVEAAIKRAEQAAQHAPRGWRERLQQALGLEAPR
jgi:cell division protein FtsL